MVSDLFELFGLPALVAFVVVVLTTPLVIWFYRYQGWVDDPKKNLHPKVTHTKPVPRGGGVSVFLGLLVAGGWFLGMSGPFLPILLASLVLVITGVADDIFDLDPYLRIGLGLLAGLFVVLSGIGIEYVTNPFASGQVWLLDSLTWIIPGLNLHISPISDLLALVFILWIINIVNWSKGVDGQMPGFVVVASLFIGILSLRFVSDPNQWPVTMLAGITSGAYLGLLIYNHYPQKIMPGYGGGSLAGFLLAVLAILSGAKVAALVLLLGIPITDALYSIIRRLIAGKSPVWGDRGHLHHRLIDAGWSKLQVARFYWLSTFILGIISLNLNSNQKFFTFVTIGLIVGGLILHLRSVSKQPIEKTK